MRNELIDFRVPSESSLSASFLANGEFMSVTKPWTQIPYWHQGEALEVQIQLKLDVTKVLEETGIPATSSLKIGLSLYSPKTRVKLICIEAISEEGIGVAVIEAPPHHLGGDVTIQAFITLVHASGALTDSLTPPTNAIIWSQEIRCELEGDQGRAEIHPTDFEASSDLNNKSLWIIDTSFPSSVSEWVEAEINNSISVRYNEKRMEEIHSPMGTQLLKAEYVRSILEEVINAEGLLDFMLGFKGDQELWGSLLKTAFDIVSTVVPGATATEIASSWNYNQKSIESRIQGLASK